MSDNRASTVEGENHGFRSGEHARGYRAVTAEDAWGNGAALACRKRCTAYLLAMKINFAPALVAAAALVASCDSDILDVDVELASHAYTADFGQSPGSIPTLSCDPGMPAACGTGMSVAGGSTVGGAPAEVEVAAGCDAASLRCFAQAHARLSYELDVLKDDAFVTKVERHAISVVRTIDLSYTVPVNTLTFDVPAIDVYVGPPGATTESDAGVTLVDRVSSVAAGVTFTDEPRHLALTDASPARTFLEQTIQAKQPFVFVLVTAPRMEAGAPMPGGAFSIEISPLIRLGLR